MPKFGTFKFAQERYGEKPPRYAHLPTLTGEITYAAKFGEAKFDEAQFGTGTGWEARTENYPPLTLGPQARKQIGKKIIYRIRNNRQQQYKYFKPYNPQKPDQQAHRSKFADAVADWKALPPAEKEAWERAAEGTSIPGRNLFIREEMLS